MRVVQRSLPRGHGERIVRWNVQRHGLGVGFFGVYVERFDGDGPRDRQ
jgi:hypothetical protein